MSQSQLVPSKETGFQAYISPDRDTDATEETENQGSLVRAGSDEAASSDCAQRRRTPQTGMESGDAIQACASVCTNQLPPHPSPPTHRVRVRDHRPQVRGCS